MGRKPAGEKLSNADKLKRYRKKNKEILKEKDNLRKRKSRGKFMKDFTLLHKEKVKQKPKRRKERRQKNAANKNIDEEPLVDTMKFPALSRSLKRAKGSLPRDRAQKRAAVKALFEDTIPVTPRKSPFTLPGRNHQVYVGKDVNGDRQYRTKKYLLWTY